MKAASTVFIIIGTIFNIIFAFNFMNQYSSYLQPFHIVLILLGLGFSIIVGQIAIFEKKKFIHIGVLCLIFVSLLGGIFYLCIKEK